MEIRDASEVKKQLQRSYSSNRIPPAAGLNSGVLYLSYLRLGTDSSGCTAHGNGSNGFTNLLASTDCKP